MSLPVSVSVLAGCQRVLFDVCFHSLDSMYLLCERLPRFLSIFAQVSTCIVIDLWMRFRAFFTPGFLPAPMRLPPRCLVWFIVVKIARCSRAPVLITLMAQAKLALVNPLGTLSTQRPRNDPSGRMLQNVAVVSLALPSKPTDAGMSAGLAKTPPLRCSVIIPRRPVLSIMCVVIFLFCFVWCLERIKRQHQTWC